MLGELGHDVLVANSEDEALIIFERHPDIDLVLTDEVMPGLSGSQLGEQVRGLRPATSVAVASGCRFQSITGAGPGRVAAIG